MFELLLISSAMYHEKSVLLSLRRKLFFSFILVVLPTFGRKVGSGLSYPFLKNVFLGFSQFGFSVIIIYFDSLIIGFTSF